MILGLDPLSPDSMEIDVDNLTESTNGTLALWDEPQQIRKNPTATVEPTVSWAQEMELQELRESQSDAIPPPTTHNTLPPNQTLPPTATPSIPTPAPTLLPPPPALFPSMDVRYREQLSTPTTTTITTQMPATNTPSHTTTTPSTEANVTTSVSVPIPSHLRQTNLPPIVDLTRPNTSKDEKHGPFTNITQRVLGHLASHPRNPLPPTPTTRNTLTSQVQGFLSSIEGATRKPRPLFAPSTTAPPRPLFAPPTPRQSTPHTPRPSLSSLCPAAQLWWCENQTCGFSNPLASRFCGHCGTARPAPRPMGYRKRPAGN